MSHLNDNEMDVSSYDDLELYAVAGMVRLECPTCGVIDTPRRSPTLSDFTNAAIDHLAEHHPTLRARAA